ncbi:Facilitated trehalose transporter Tret1, partial [Gryllus bimaculatus]
MYFSRLMVGFTMGVASIVVPIYTEEISEVRVRGALCVWARALRHAGLALAVALGVALPFPHTTLLPCFVPLALLVLLPGVPESPAFLVRKGLLREARLAL